MLQLDLEMLNLGNSEILYPNRLLTHDYFLKQVEIILLNCVDFWNNNGIILIHSFLSVWFPSNKMTQFSLMLHTTFPPSQLVENKLIVWLLFLARTDVRSKKDSETLFLRTTGRAVNVSPITCSLFLESKTHVRLKDKWHNLTISVIPSRNKNLHELPPEHQWANLPEESIWIIIIPFVWNTRWNSGNLRFAWLNANHLSFFSRLKVTKRCEVHLKSAPKRRPTHVGIYQNQSIIVLVQSLDLQAKIIFGTINDRIFSFACKIAL